MRGNNHAPIWSSGRRSDSSADCNNASGVRDTARSLHISTDTVLSELKKKEPVLESVNTALLRRLNADEVTVDIERAGEAEMDEMWSFVGRKDNPRWLWHAIDHQTGKVLAYGLWPPER